MDRYEMNRRIFSLVSSLINVNEDVRALVHDLGFNHELVHVLEESTISEADPTKKKTVKKESTEPITRSKPLVKGKNFEYPGDFNCFWKLYPRKSAKQQAFMAWNKLTDEEKKKCEIAVENQLKNGIFSEQKKWVPHPATWLNGRRWEDEVTLDKSCKVGTNEDNWGWE